MSLRANIILKEFGITQGVPDMKFNEDGICSFLIDEEYDITLIADSDEKNIHVWCFSQYHNRRRP